MNLLFSFLPTLLYGLTDALAAGTAKRVPAVSFVLLQNIITLSLFLLTSFFILPTSLFSSWAVLYALGGGFFLVTGFLSFVRGLALGKAGVITAIAHGYILLSAVAGIVFLNESSDLWRLLGIGVVISGLLLLMLDYNELRSRSIKLRGDGIPYAIFTMVAWTLGYALQKLAADSLPLIEAAVFVEIGAILVSFSLFFFGAYKISDYAQIKKYDVSVIIFTGFAFFVTQVTLIALFKYFDLGLITTIAGTSSMVTAVLAYWFYRQKLSQQEIYGICITVIGLVLLGWFA